MKGLIVITICLFFISFPGSNAIAIHKTIPAETESTETLGITIQPVRSSQTETYRLKALINLLERKGLISKEELQKEIERLMDKE
jgi:hypothetical protein